VAALVDPMCVPAFVTVDAAKELPVASADGPAAAFSAAPCSGSSPKQQLAVGDRIHQSTRAPSHGTEKRAARILRGPLGLIVYVTWDVLGCAGRASGRGTGEADYRSLIQPGISGSLRAEMADLVQCVNSGQIFVEVF
jgi:hypothetical protein